MIVSTINLLVVLSDDFASSLIRFLYAGCLKMVTPKQGVEHCRIQPDGQPELDDYMMFS